MEFCATSGSFDILYLGKLGLEHGFRTLGHSHVHTRIIFPGGYAYLKEVLIYRKIYLIYHREDGPASIVEDTQEWYFNGRRHRADGPAYINDHMTAWYEHGIPVPSRTI